MGMGVDEYSWVGPMLYKLAKHVADIAALGGTGEKLPVTVRASTSLAKTPVAVGVHLTAAHHLGDVLATLLHGKSPLYNDGLQPQLKGMKRREKSGRTSTDNNHRRGVMAIFVRGTVVGRNVTLTDEIDVGLCNITYRTPRVQTPPHHFDMRNVAHSHPYLPCSGSPKQPFIRVLLRPNI